MLYFISHPSTPFLKHNTQFVHNHFYSFFGRLIPFYIQIFYEMSCTMLVGIIFTVPVGGHLIFMALMAIKKKFCCRRVNTLSTTYSE